MVKDGKLTTLPYTVNQISIQSNEKNVVLQLDDSERVIEILHQNTPIVSYEYTLMDVNVPEHLEKVIYSDGTSRHYLYETPSFPNMVTGIIVIPPKINSSY
jgi:hypothetical protein